MDSPVTSQGTGTVRGFPGWARVKLEVMNTKERRAVDFIIILEGQCSQRSGDSLEEVIQVSSYLNCRFGIKADREARTRKKAR
jgi:hypothetical protein